MDPTNLSRELASLEKLGLFTSETKGVQKFFSLNHGYPLFKEIRGIILGTVGAARQLQKALKDVKGLQEAYLYGSFARNQEDAASDIDVLIVGKPNAERLEEVFSILEKQLGREINYTIFSPQEFKKRRARKDPFLADVFGKKKINLLLS